MKTISPLRRLGLKLLTLGSLAFIATGVLAADPKRALVVTTTMGFRHSSIPTAERVLATIATNSGVFSVEFARVEPTDPEFKGADGKPDSSKVKAAIARVLEEKMNVAALKNYDLIIFANTTGGRSAGDLPLPDKQAFLDWIKSGKAFVGMHSATDTFRGHQPVDSYVEMIGGEFKSHPPGLYDVVCNIEDPKHPACADFQKPYEVKDEIYMLNAFHRDRVHMLLSLDKHPRDRSEGYFPIAWCKEYGKGKVFYTSLGHAETVWEDPIYQKHILGGIKWGLGLLPGDAKPQTPAASE